VDEAFSFFAEKSLKGATAPCAVQRPLLRPLGIPAVEIAEFHAATTASSFFLFYPFPPGRVQRFSVVILSALGYEKRVAETSLLR
jgi:hypothetical protein